MGAVRALVGMLSVVHTFNRYQGSSQSIGHWHLGMRDQWCSEQHYQNQKSKLEKPMAPQLYCSCGYDVHHYRSDFLFLTYQSEPTVVAMS